MSMTPKELVGMTAAKRIHDGMLVGLGTGSTAKWFTHYVAERVRAENLMVRCVCTSDATEHQARAAGLSVIPLGAGMTLDICVKNNK